MQSPIESIPYGTYGAHGIHSLSIDDSGFLLQDSYDITNKNPNLIQQLQLLNRIYFYSEDFSQTIACIVTGFGESSTCTFLNRLWYPYSYICRITVFLILLIIFWRQLLNQLLHPQLAQAQIQSYHHYWRHIGFVVHWHLTYSLQGWCCWSRLFCYPWKYYWQCAVGLIDQQSNYYLIKCHYWHKLVLQSEPLPPWKRHLGPKSLLAETGSLSSQIIPPILLFLT